MWLMEHSQEKRAGLNHVRFADEELIKTQVLQGEAAQTIIPVSYTHLYTFNSIPNHVDVAAIHLK